MGKKVERTVTAALIIEAMCKDLRMTEEQLLVHLAVENSGTLPLRLQRDVLIRSQVYYEQNIFVVERTT